MPSDSKVGTTRGSAPRAGTAAASAMYMRRLRISHRGCAEPGDASTAGPATGPSTVGLTLTTLSNVDYILERKAEIKMAKRHPPAYTFRPQGNITDKGRGRCEFS